MRVNVLQRGTPSRAGVCTIIAWHRDVTNSRLQVFLEGEKLNGTIHCSPIGCLSLGWILFKRDCGKLMILRFRPRALLLAVLSYFVSWAAMAQNTTNWATWTLPSSYDLAFEGDGSGSWSSGADYAPGATGSVIDPQTGQTVNFILSGEVAKYSSIYGSWSGSEYSTDVSPNTPVWGETSYQIG